MKFSIKGQKTARITGNNTYLSVVVNAAFMEFCRIRSAVFLSTPEKEIDPDSELGIIDDHHNIKNLFCTGPVARFMIANE